MSTKHEITGRIKLIGETQTFPSGFTKREIVVTTDEKFPQDVKFDFVKDGCEKLESYRKGDEVTISYNVRGNEYNGKYYVSLQGWRIDGNNGQQARSAPQNGPEPQASEPRNMNVPSNREPANEDIEDTIPF